MNNNIKFIIILIVMVFLFVGCNIKERYTESKYSKECLQFIAMNYCESKNMVFGDYINIDGILRTPGSFECEDNDRYYEYNILYHFDEKDYEECKK